MCGSVLFGKGCVLFVIICWMIYVVFGDINGFFDSGLFGCNCNFVVFLWWVNVLYVVVILLSCVFVLFRISERLGVVLVGKYSGRLMLCSFVVNCFGL